MIEALSITKYATIVRGETIDGQFSALTDLIA